MRHSRAGAGIGSGAPAGRLALGLLAVCCALAFPATAPANNLFTLDSHTASTGPIVTEANGTGYVAWNHQAPASPTGETPMFCKIPRGGSCTDSIELPLPTSGEPQYEGVVQPFPVLGSTPGVVYVVGPRYDRDNVLIWTSTDGGEKFSSATVVPAGYNPGKTNVGDVLLDPNTPSGIKPGEDYFGIAANNPGLSFGFTASEITSGSTSFTFENPGAGGVASSTLGYVTHTIEDSFTKKQIYPEIEAYYNDSTPYETFFYRYYAKEGNVDGEEKGWEGPLKVTDGYEPRLAGGPDGLFMLSTDLAPGKPAEEQPSVIDVRKFNESTRQFGPPTTIANITTSVGTLGISGDIYENPETGVLYVAQPVTDSKGDFVMRLWESSDGGQSFHGERDIATIGSAYSGIPRLAVAADGQGWLTFEDSGGLEVADLTALSTTRTPSLTIPKQTDIVSSKGALSVVLDCAGARCSGSLTLIARVKTTGKGKPKTVTETIGNAPFSSLALGADRVSVKLSGKGLSLLKHDGYKLNTTGRATYRSGSASKTATGSVTLKGHKASPKK